MTPEFEQTRNILIETVTLLCKNSLQYDRKLSVQGLIGITIDDGGILLVHIDEQYKSKPASLSRGDSSAVPVSELDAEDRQILDCDDPNVPDGICRPSRNKRVHRKRKHRTVLNANVCAISASVANSGEEKLMKLKSTSSPSLTTMNTDNLNTSMNRLAQNNFKRRCESRDEIENEVHSYTGMLHAIKSEGGDDSTGVTKYFPMDADEFSTVEMLGRGKRLGDEIGFSKRSFEVGGYSGDHGRHSLEMVESGQSGDVSQERAFETRALDHRAQTTASDQSCCGNNRVRPSSMNLHWPTRERRSRVAVCEKMFRCDYELCGKTYYDKKNLLRHQTCSHGRKPSYNRHRIHGEFSGFVGADVVDTGAMQNLVSAVSFGDVGLQLATEERSYGHENYGDSNICND